MRSGDEIYTRSPHHPELRNRLAALDIIDLNPNLLSKELIKTTVHEILAKAQNRNVVYASEPGGLTYDSFAIQLAEEAKQHNIVVEYNREEGVLEEILKRAEISFCHGVCIADGLCLAVSYAPPFPPSLPAIIVGMNTEEMAASIKKNLSHTYPLSYGVTIFGYDKDGKWRSIQFSLEHVSSNPIRAMGILYIPPMGKDTSFESFQDLVAHLRSPEGCPWDREQTHASLRANLLEETYEALNALDKSDWLGVCEELGDLLLQICLHTQIAVENKEFSMPQLIHAIQSKLVRRHPHVFAQLGVDGIGEILRNWEEIKAKERKDNGEEQKSLLDGVPLSYPALAQAQDIQARAARVGFDWEEIAPVFDKVFEEIDELKQAKDAASTASEIGDLLFAIVNIARWMKVDAESALRETNQRFRKRFRYIEDQVRQQGKQLKNMTLQEMDILWEQAKAFDNQELGG